MKWKGALSSRDQGDDGGLVYYDSFQTWLKLIKTHLSLLLPEPRIYKETLNSMLLAMLLVSAVCDVVTLIVLKVPLKHLLEDTLSIGLHNISVTGNDSIEVPAINPLNGLVKGTSILRRKRVPKHPLLPKRLPLRTLNLLYKPAHPPLRYVFASAGVLFVGRAGEH